MKVTNNLSLHLKAIQVDDYWVIVDTNAEIKSMDYFIDLKYNTVMKYFVEGNLLNSSTKIIASINKRIDKSIPVIRFVKKDLDYWKSNAEEDYMSVPISVLRYITELEQAKSSDKKYTEEDIRKTYESGQNNILGQDVFVNRLNQSKLPETIHLEFESLCKQTGVECSSELNKNCQHICSEFKLKTTKTEQGSEIIINI